ncbi:leucyl aminopeptidase family protein [Cohaesibacter marisflavi]|uniref:leucyl aminopeptidase family protein n=1 Tax=Cohaesibacter marisflavi TaxID=655353 RepID=UPI0038993503
MRAYSFDVYKAPQPLVKSVSYCGTEDLSDTTLNGLKVDVDAIHFARDLVNEPANELPPLKMAARVISACEEAGIKTQLLDQKALQKEGMGLLLGVGQGSDNPPCAVVMTIGKGKSAPAALIGKGICFDTGGVNVKSVMGMWEMKGDMAGAAVVTSAMLSLAKNGFKGDIVAVIGLAENMTGGSAIRPGDILRSYNGQTVEVRNTDCEGRLVLADCLSYAQRQLGARKVIDIATLTYAVQIGLGTRYAGIYGNAETLLSSVKQAADSACELVWPMPIDEAFHAQLKSDFADMLNWPGVTYGNASIAAAFLENFIDDGVEWAHIDVGGPAYAGAESAFAPPGGTGFGTETLANLARLIA